MLSIWISVFAMVLGKGGQKMPGKLLYSNSKIWQRRLNINILCIHCYRNQSQWRQNEFAQSRESSTKRTRGPRARSSLRYVNIGPYTAIYNLLPFYLSIEFCNYTWFIIAVTNTYDCVAIDTTTFIVGSKASNNSNGKLPVMAGMITWKSSNRTNNYCILCIESVSP